jgi:hypothetical protein
MARKYGAYPYTDARCSGADPEDNILRFSSSPTANVNDPKVN